MKKALIITLYGNDNYGNKLQNYALQQSIKKIDDAIDVTTIKVRYEKNIKNIFVYEIWKILYSIKKIMKKSKIDPRKLNFIEFNKNYLKYSRKYIGTNSFKKIKGYDLYIYGSDQIWNPNGVGISKLFIGALTNNNISYAASIGANSIPSKYLDLYKKNIEKFKYVSVREDKGKEILNRIIKNKNVDVLIDPTMLLSSEEWDEITEKPIMLKSDKYILNYFLGDLSNQRKKEIERIANKNNCEIINLLDSSSPFYTCGPSEFLYLEKNAFLICTDSFHSSVFATLYNRPFIVFNREEKNMDNMESRLDTLISKFKLKNRRYNGERITKENLEHDYSDAYKILEKERKKSEYFLKKILKTEDLNKK